MARWQASNQAILQPRLPLEVFDHLLAAVPVFANHQVDVVRHDCTGIASVSVSRDDDRERTGDFLNL
jgi:hypothetical protein